MPERFLLPILHNLVTHGILRSTRGDDGGYTLTRRPEDVSLLDLIEAIEGPMDANEGDVEIGDRQRERLLAGSHGLEYRDLVANEFLEQPRAHDSQQPIMAGDLRMLASILEVVGELERMGDYAKGIAKICVLIDQEPHVKPLIDIPRNGPTGCEHAASPVGAFVNLDVETASQIPAEDDEVDGLYNQVYRELVAIMLANTATIDQSNHLMWVAHNLERVSDRVTNICERTIYVATGKLAEVDNTDDEAPGI